MEFIKVILFIPVGILSLGNVEFRLRDRTEITDSDGVYYRESDSSIVVYKSFDRRYIGFLIYTRARPNGFRLGQNPHSLRKSGFNNSNPTKFLVHGYMGSSRSPSVQMPKNAYMATDDYNVIIVDWSLYAFPYAVAVSSVPEVGTTLGSMIAFLSRAGRADPSRVHVIGYSLGAHIAGYAGQSVKSRKRTAGLNKLSRITGLDPAAPAFSDSPPNRRLSPDDALYVDVIHTSIRLLGMAKRIGHADFYPNGGSNQPRCPAYAFEQAAGLCDHSQSYVYFSQSIRNRYLFPAVKCNNVRDAKGRRCSGESRTFMGEESARGPGGIYYVNVKKRGNG